VIVILLVLLHVTVSTLEECCLQLVRTVCSAADFLVCNCLPLPIFTARSSYASAVLGIVILSVHLSVRHTGALWRNERTYRTAKILTPHEKIFNLVFWHQKRLVDDVPFHLKFALKVTYPLWKTPTSTNICLWRLNRTNSEKCSIIANRKSTTCFPTSYRWSAYVTHYSSKKWLKNEFVVF